MRTVIGIGFSTNRDPFEAGQDAAMQAKDKIIKTKPKLVFVFTSIHFKNEKLLEGVYSTLGPDTYLLGGTGAGIITNTGIHKYGVTILIIQSDIIEFSTGLIGTVDKRNPRTSGEKFARQTLKKLKSKTREIAIIFSDGLIERGSEILLGIKEVLGRSFPIIGGSAADNLRFDKTYQFFNKEVLNNAIAGAILAGEGTFGYGLHHGWKPIGRSHIVNASQGNVVHEIENRPAVEIYETYFKKTREEIKSLFSQISILYPLGIYLPGEEEYLLRNPIRINSLGGLVCQGDIPVGSQIKMMMGTKESTLQAVKQATWEAKHALNDVPVLAAIIFESVARSKLLGYRANEEIGIIKDILGPDVPFIGVCTFGEQAPLKSFGYHGESHFHNETIAVITIGERHVALKHA